ncbi:MAG: phosphate regulon sensor histidine kinase PhoR [Porticoccaceae bacterium]
MQEGFRSEIQRIILLSVALFIVGLLNGLIAETLLFGAVAYGLYTLNKIRKIYAWLYSDKNDMPPEMSGIWGDICDELYRVRQRVEQAKKNYSALALRIRQITSALDDGMILLNADRTLDWWNPSATSLLNFGDKDRGESISNLIRNPVFVNFIHSKDFTHPLEMRAPNNPHRIYQFMAGTFGRGEVILMVRDITRLRHLEEMRKEFVANISHELRTPLTVLVGYIETLQSNSESLPNHWHKALVQMDQQTRRLSALAEDLVMLSRLESSPPDTHKEEVNICTMLTSMVDNAKVISEKHRLSLDCQPGLTLAGTQRELHSAFSNLIFNAIKHNPQGCDIHISARREHNQLIVDVADTGIGIDQKHLPRLTERFYRVDDSRTSSSGGTGLGLAIVKHVLARHQGSLNIRSTLSKGSTFSCVFNLPNSGE